MASSSSVSVFDNHRFKTAFNGELYNTIVKNFTEEEMEEHGGHSYKSFVRGVPINFSPENIRSVMQFKAQVEGARTDFETRKEHDEQLDSVLADLCMPGATWKLSTEEIIADKMVRMTQGIKEKGKLGFPSTIYNLCKEAGVPLREFRRTKKILVEKPITARRMESTRLPRNLQHHPQDNEDEGQSMPQAEEGHEEGQGEEHDYQHHQPEFQHEPQFQQPPLYEVPTYTYQHEKDLHSIEEQLQNMMWYQQQCLENINKSQVEYMAELRTIKAKQQEIYENNDRFYNQVREKQREMAKKIQ
ncbi:hypothetical protein PIB30_104193 [Stylosanthes scabra]|uniref:Uncharacterized protein n=1 Tax=Stylosanthes scabra TaxID=79078 RepID=A0ABU6YWH8_9FABA|nr:hypothetical protein [Stylosanthes scabra]